LYNLLSGSEVFGLSRDQAAAQLDSMLAVVRGWREIFRAHGVDAEAIAMLERAILPESFFSARPPDAV
jgi:hypothetical protein